MENWATEINLKIDERLKQTREKDLRFFRVDEFKRNIKRVNEFAVDCSFCRMKKDDISTMVDNLFEAIDVPGKSRREYDKLISRLSKHMQKEHGFYPPFYFSYLYAFFGLIAGFGIGYVLTLFFPAHLEAMYSIGFMIGIITSYILGSAKDKKIRGSKKIM